MNTRKQHDPWGFIQDLYDLMGMNGMKIPAFFYKYVENDNAFMVGEDEEGNPAIIMDEFDIVIKSK